MKIKNLFLSGLACLAMTACSNNDEPGAGQETLGDQYIALNIVTGNENNSRASENDFQNGTEDENAASTALVYFFQDGNYHSSKIVNLTWGNASTTTSPQIEEKSDAVIVLEKPTSLPNQMVVILNAPNEFTNSNLSLEQLKAKAGEYGACTNGTFIMSNSVWGSNCEVAITASDLHSTETLAKASPIDVYVERVVARIDVTQNDNTATTVDPIKNVGDDTSNDIPVTDYQNSTLSTTDLTITTEITGYHIAGANKYSYILKNLPTASDSYWKGTNKEWNDANNKRSYWAHSYRGTSKPAQTGIYHKYDDGKLTGSVAKTLYCQEKTDGQTYLVITAQHKLNNTATSFIKYLTLYYTEEGFKKTIAQDLATKGYTLSKTVDGNTTTNSDWYPYLKIERSSSVSDDSNTGKWRIQVTLDTSAMTTAEWTVADATATNVNEVLATYKNAWEWKYGKAYYYVPIEHINSTTNDKEYAVVRNHLYQLNIESITGLGTPIYDPNDDNDGTPDDNEEEIIPEKPTDSDSYVAARINVLKWRIVKQQNITIN